MQAQNNSKDWLWRPSLIVFFSNACVMTIELVADRIIAPFVGVSLYTWTSVIGVILAGMSVGNFIGGKLADRYASKRLLGGMFIVAGIGSLLVLLMVGAFGGGGFTVTSGLPLPLRMVLFVAFIFFVPSALLGTISPLVVKLTLVNLNQTGNVIGRIYAASALGSILGTFATGYFLISWAGTSAIMLGVGIALVIIGLLFIEAPRNRFAPAIGSAVLVVAIVSISLVTHGALTRGQCLRETDYYCIRVTDKVLVDKSTLKVLSLDHLVHSASSLDDPLRLFYPYLKATAELTEYVAQRNNAPMRMLFIGGGGYTFPRYVEKVYPQSVIDVIEVDPGVTAVAYEQLGLKPDTIVKTYNEDARTMIKAMPASQRYDIVYGDAFNDFTVPYHLVTLEFNQMVLSHMTDDGIYVLNLIDGKSLPFVSAFMRTLRQIFHYTYLIPADTQWESQSRETYVVVASNIPIDTARLRLMTGGDKERSIDEWLLPESRVEALLKDGSQFILTDDYVPVDNLLAPIYSVSGNVQ